MDLIVATQRNIKNIWDFIKPYEDFDCDEAKYEKTFIYTFLMYCGALTNFALQNMDSKNKHATLAVLCLPTFPIIFASLLKPKIIIAPLIGFILSNKIAKL